MDGEFVQCTYIHTYVQHIRSSILVYCLFLIISSNKKKVYTERHSRKFPKFNFNDHRIISGCHT